MYDDDDLEGWADDEMGVAAGFVMAFMVGFAATTIVAAAIAWNAVSFAAEAVQALRRR